MQVKIIVAGAVAVVAAGVALAGQPRRPGIVDAPGEVVAAPVAAGRAVVPATLPTLPAVPVLRAVAVKPGDSPNAAFRRKLSAERYDQFVAAAKLTPAQRADLDAVIVDVCNDLDEAYAELTAARADNDLDRWLEFQRSAYAAAQDDLEERITAILTPDQLTAVGGPIGIMRAFPASTLVGLGGLLAP